MKIKHTKDNFVSFCVVGGCPEIKQDGNEYILRNSHKREETVRFSKDDLVALHAGLKNYV